MKQFEIVQGFLNVPQKQELNSCCWKNGTDKLAQYRAATNLQFVKATISSKYNKGNMLVLNCTLKIG